MNVRILLTFLSLLISSLAFSQSSPLINVQIKGVVTDSLTNETVPYATVKLLGKANSRSPLKAVAADDNGNFQFSMNKKGEYLLTVEYIGKKTLVKPVVVGDAKIVDLGTIYMSDNENALSEVVVSAQKPLVKVDLDKIVYSMESDPESTTNNLLEMLKKVPMVTVDGEDNVQLKGSTNFKIYLNGKPSNMISNNPKEVLRSMPANTVKDIQVITDPGAKYDAEGVAGIINIITNTSMGGYTATLNGRVDSQGGYGLGAYWTMKYGKVGFTGNYNYYEWKRPEGTSSSFREYNLSNNPKYLTGVGPSKNNGLGQFGSGELSYEIDTLNLINIGFNRFEGDYKSRSNIFNEGLGINKDSQYRYDQRGYMKQTYGGTDLNVDYQRTFHKKEQLLTASYKFSMNPNDSESNSDITELFGELPKYVYTNKQYSDADMKEHTFQVDFVTPLNKSDILSHSVETGVKYIIRINNSNSGLDSLNATGNWVAIERSTDRFRHTQDILAAYGGYNAKFRNVWGFKAGLRYEATWLNAEFPKDRAQDFKVDYSNIVPSATVTYQINPMQNLRFGYNMRISRPGIWQLNPYENTSDPNNIQKGNPALDAVKNHTISTNYGLFNRNLTLNVNLAYSFENNGIEQITTEQNKVVTSTYENIGKRKDIGLSLNLRWTPKMGGDKYKWLEQLSIFSNMGARYVDIKANNGSGLKKDGVSANVFGGAQYSFPKSWKAFVNVGYFSPYINLQSENSSFFFHRFNVSKGFNNDKLNISAYAQNPFKRIHDFRSTMNNQAFYSETIMSNKIQNFGISVSFRFGEMKSQIQKARRGIKNDDVMSGGQGEQSGGSAGGQN